MNKQAVAKVHQALREIDVEMKALTARLEGYRDTDNAVVNWGHVGDLQYIKTLLRTANGKED